MGIYLPAPDYNHRGPDGQGWNRLSVGWITLDECALRPTSWQTLWIAQTDTRRATYGSFGSCGIKGNCDECPVFARVREGKQLPPHAPGGRLIARPDTRQGWEGVVHVYFNPDYATPDHWSWWLTWDELAAVRGWTVGRVFSDEYGEAFELIRNQQDN